MFATRNETPEPTLKAASDKVNQRFERAVELANGKWNRFDRLGHIKACKAILAEKNCPAICRIDALRNLANIAPDLAEMEACYNEARNLWDSMFRFTQESDKKGHSELERKQYGLDDIKERIEGHKKRAEAGEDTNKPTKEEIEEAGRD